MSKVTVHAEKCKSCQFCIRECPRQAIYLTEELNAKGVRIVAVDDERCIGCGICYYVCPDCVFEVGVE